MHGIYWRSVLKTKGFVDHILVAAIVFIMLCYTLSGIFAGQKNWVFPVCGIMGITITGICVLRSKLWASYDAVLLCVFLCLSLVSATLAGVSTMDFLCSRFFSFWMMSLSMCFAVQTISDGKKAIVSFFFFSSLVLCAVSIYVIFHASGPLLNNVINEDVLKGCFSKGRLYAFGNANVLGVISAGHMLLSVAGLVENGKRNRVLQIFYLISLFIGWMTLGLTGCRAGRIAVAMAVSMFSFVLIRGKLEKDKKRLLFEIVMAVIVFAIVLSTFFLPGVIYKAVMGLIGLEIDDMGLHKILDDDGTFSGRTDIWFYSIKSSLKNARRFFFGISPISAEQLYGIYAGHHEIKVVHAHNSYIELFRKHGILGFVPMIALTIAWFVNSLKIFALKEKDNLDIFIAFMVMAVMVMGMTETLPLISSYDCYTSLLFFICCGYCMRLGREQK